ncbi:M48 family metallopeptidase [Kocuria sp. cx-116]|uniref:M48 metallopeptidase family protein n=1 Tax=Kocuria sp. cx-116 TaxID=2771378 RepID=UPI001686B49F|nr:M48 family metallopeptidase [Kocuria sp. cx-116]MBD2761012.1 M48 family metallopeptidase [Kocuria sp. cx-116]
MSPFHPPRTAQPRRPEPQPPTDSPEVLVQRSARRKKTVSAHFSGDTVILAVPQSATRREVEQWKTTLVPKIVAKRDRARQNARRRGTDEALWRMARELSATYLNGQAQPTQVKWSSRQNTRWGSATPSTGVIRISTRLATAPDWVLETVVLHELVHLLEAQHNDRFWSLARKHPRANDAAQFLDGVAWADTNPREGSAATN